jgi:hypothetical protein
MSKYIFVVMDATNYPANELVGIFTSHELAVSECLTENYYMFVLEIDKAIHESVAPEDYPFGLKFPVLDADEQDYPQKGSFRLPEAQ